MPMNQVIQERRKALGLTQEQVAESLNVSTPAVSKWETGASCPDVSLLAPLARLLKADLNTLLCFDEGLSPKDIPKFCKKLHTLAETEGIGSAFEAAQQELHLYPHHEQLKLTLTMVLDNFLTLSHLTEEESEPYDKKISTWYNQLTQSKEESIRQSANSMLVSRYIGRGDLGSAQRILDTMPDKNEVVQNLPDKLMLQVIIDQRQGRSEQAAMELQKALLTAVNRVCLLMAKLADAELSAGNHEAAKMIAQKSEALADLLGLWKGSACSAALSIAFKEQDAETSLRLIRTMLEALRHPWDLSQAPLFSRIEGRVSQDAPAMLYKTMMESLETDPSCGFLRDTQGYRDLMAEYKKA